MIMGVSCDHEEPVIHLYSKWLLLSWLLHKQKREFSYTNFEIGKPCQCFE